MHIPKETVLTVAVGVVLTVFFHGCWSCAGIKEEGDTKKACYSTVLKIAGTSTQALSSIRCH